MTEKEYAESLPEEMKMEFEKVESGEITLMDMAEKYKMTFRQYGRTYAKGGLLNAFTAWKNYCK